MLSTDKYLDAVNLWCSWYRIQMYPVCNIQLYYKSSSTVPEHSTTAQNIKRPMCQCHNHSSADKDVQKII